MIRVRTWLQERRWLALAGCVAGLVVYVLLADFVPRAAKVYAVFDTWQEQQARILSLADATLQQEHLEARRRTLQGRFDRLYVNLPRSDQISVLVQVLQQSAEAVEVGLQQIRPAERKTFAGHDALPFQVVLLGSFHEIGRFINRVEQSAYVIKVEHVRLTRMRPPSKALQAEVRLNVIVLKEQPSEP